MLVPGFINLMVRLYLGCNGRERFRDRFSGILYAFFSPLHPLFVIALSVNSAIRTLRGEENEVYKNIAKEFKLVEIIGEL